jgi:hypothetical protein
MHNQFLISLQQGFACSRPIKVDIALPGEHSSMTCRGTWMTTLWIALIIAGNFRESSVRFMGVIRHAMQATPRNARS